MLDVGSNNWLDGRAERQVIIRPEVGIGITVGRQRRAESEPDSHHFSPERLFRSPLCLQEREKQCS